MNIAKLGCLAAVVALCAASAQAATLRTNEFYFSVPNLEQGFEFELKQHDVTKGQPYNGVYTEIDTAKHYASIFVKAGRKGSYDVGIWFRKQVGSGDALAPLAKGKLPEELNFGISGDLTIKAGGARVVCKDVVLGQGHTLPSFNNWWVGGPNMKIETDDKGRKLLRQRCEGGTILTGVGGVGVNNFDLYVSGP